MKTDAWKAWTYPVWGTLGGLAYVLLDEGLMDHIQSHSPFALVFHEFLDALFPVLLGFSIGWGFYFFKKQRRLNMRLSMNNEKLEKDLLTSALISQMLHEIRNPLHNLTAALEDMPDTGDTSRTQVIQRSLERLADMKRQYGQWSHLLEGLEPDKRTEIKPWLNFFIDDKINDSLREKKIHLSRHVEPAQVAAHPILLEQIFSTLFSNATEALSNHEGMREMDLVVRRSLDPAEPSVLVSLSNNGRLFPEEALQTQGLKPVHSSYGMGMGLVILRKILERAGGSLRLANQDGRAVVTLKFKDASA